jgi:hypothetical protein
MPQPRNGETNLNRDTSNASETKITLKRKSLDSSLRTGFRRDIYKLDPPEREYTNKNSRQDIDHTFTTEYPQSTPNEIHMADKDTILEVMADFVSDPKNSHTIPKGKELEYAQQHFHHSEYFNHLTQKEKDLFINEIHTADKDTILEVMANFVSDPKNSHTIPKGKELEHAQQHFHHSEYFNHLTQKEKDLFINEIHSEKSEKSLDEKIKDFKEKIEITKNGISLDDDIRAQLSSSRSEKNFRRNLEKLRQKGEDINHICNIVKYMVEKEKTPKLSDLYPDTRQKASITISDEAADLGAIIIDHATLGLEDNKRKKLRQLLYRLSETSKGRQKINDNRRKQKNQ